jgi:hypothetical protein
MKLISALLIVLSVSLVGCKDRNATPPTSGNAQGASEAMRADSKDIAKRLAEQKAATDANFEAGQAAAEKQRLADSLAAIGQRWAAALDETYKAGRSDMATPIQKLNALKAEAGTLAVNECTGAARATLLNSMSTTIDGFNQFAKETGAASEATQQVLMKGATQLNDFDKQLAGCR